MSSTLRDTARSQPERQEAARPRGRRPDAGLTPVRELLRPASDRADAASWGAAGDRPQRPDRPPLAAPELLAAGQPTWSYARPRLRVSQPGDPFEQAADRLAEAVMRAPAAAVQQPGCPTCDEREAGLIHRESVQPAAAALPPAAVLDAAAPGDGGQALPGSVQDFFGSRFSAASGSIHDFSRVRIHTGPRAEAAAAALDARAYTLGRDIVFAAGEYAPHTDAGQRLLAHELAHVIQQRPGVLQRDNSGSSGPSVSMPSLTSLLFRYGDLRLEANLPTEVVATLPVELRNVGTLSFSMTADIPNNFSLAITLDTEPHIRIRTQVGYNRETGVLSTGLVIQSTEKSCTIPDAAEVQTQLQAAGRRATTALQNFLNPPTPAPSTSGESGPALPPEIARAVELGSAIGDLYSKAKAAGAGQRCITRPVWSLDFGARIPVNPPGAGPDIFGPSERERAPQPYFGLGFTYHF